MAKAKKRRFHRFRKHVHKPGKPSLMSILTVAIPQLVSNSGVAGFGYDALASGISLTDRLKLLGANEILLMTGYDIVSHQTNMKGPLLFYGLPLAQRLARMIIGPKRVGKFSVW